MNPRSKLILRSTTLLLIFFMPFFNTTGVLVEAQSFSSKNFLSENGLAHNYILDIVQDETGFMWFATWDGISRFDGYEFRNYYHKPNDTTTFPFFIVDKLIVDITNQIWVLCPSKPLYLYNRVTDNFQKFNLIKDNSFTDISADDKGTLWLIDETRLFQYFPLKQQIKPIKMVNTYSGELFRFEYKPQVVIDNQGKLWFFEYFPMGAKVFSGAFKNDSIIEIKPLKDIVLAGKKSFQTKTFQGFNVYSTKSNETCLFSKYGLFKLDSANNGFIPGENMADYLQINDKSGYYWIDDNSGLHFIDPKTGRQIILPNPPGAYYETAFADKKGNIWTGTVSQSRANTGLTMFHEMPANFNHYLTEPTRDNELNLVFPILKDQFGSVWAGMRNADNIFRIKPGFPVEKIDFFAQFPENEKPKVRTMVEDSSGIWMGCTNNYIIFFDFQTEKFSVLNSSPYNFENTSTPLNIHNLTKKGDFLIFSGWEGIYSLSIQKRKLKLEYPITTKGAIFCMTSDNMGGFWIGSNTSTIIHLDSDFKEIGVYKIGDEADNIEHICLGNNNDLWVAIMGGGLGHFYPSTGESEIITTADGLPNNTLYSILKDKHGNLWISTNKGLSQFNPNTRTFRNFGEDEGLRIEEFNSDSFFLSEDGEIFFGGVGGFVAFYPDSLYLDAKIHRELHLIIPDFRISGIERRFVKAIYEMDTVQLEKGENNIQLTFALLDFNNEDKIKYRYRIAEENQNWTETNYRNRNVNYTNLSPGTYNFEVQCTDLNGNWSVSKKLVINIPFFVYQTKWFRWLLIIVCFAFVLSVVGFIIRQIRLKAYQKQNDLKLESLRGQMNPHFIFNALNSVNYFISNNDKVSANSYIADFSALIRSVLNNMANDYIPLEQEIESIREYLRLEHLRFSDKFDFDIQIEPGNLTGLSVSPGLVQPLIENAVWHGVRGLEKKKGRIGVRLFYTNWNQLKCVVEDNGIGRKQAKKYRNVLPGKRSMGIGIIEERLRILSEINKTRYTLLIEDIEPEAEETGTRATIDLPLQNRELGKVLKTRKLK